MRGCFITFEGLDGSGKTTQLELLARRLRRAGLRVVVAREPGGTRIGDAIRKILLSSKTAGLQPAAEMLLYFASRAQNFGEVIRPALDAGSVVLCDRWTDSTRAYQGQGRGLGRQAVEQLDRIVAGGRQPDHTILIDIPHRAGVSRALRRQRTAARDESRLEREGQQFFRRVRKAYLEIARREPRRVHVVRGQGTVQEIHEKIWALTASWEIRKP
jgi:dTMP kinase